MTIRFARWELTEHGHAPRPVLRLLRSDAPLSDPDTADLFASPLAAAEAAWRLAGDLAGDSGWLDRAYAALDGEVEGSLAASSVPPPRILGSKLMNEGLVGWLRADSIVRTGDWAMASAAGMGALVPEPAFRPRPGEVSDPLSGRGTAEWALVGIAGEAAGAPGPGGSPRAILPNLTGHEGEALSGKTTGDWPFASAAGGAPLKDEAP